MSLLRNVWADLVEKRLWPLAVGLVLALVAVPIVLARGGSSAPAPPPLPPVQAPATAAAVPQHAATPIKVVEQVPHRAPHGRFHDPFSGHKNPNAKPAAATSRSSGSASAASAPSSASSAAGAAAPSSGSGASAPSSGSSAPSTHASSPTSSARTAPAAPAVVPSGYPAGYRLDVDFGPAGDVKRSKDLLRLKPLAAGAKPLAIYLGVRTDGRTAMFLLTRNGTATGDGKCWPSKAACQVLELRKGDSEFFDVPTGATGVVQYELDVDRVGARYDVTHVGAVNARKRESKAGRREMLAIVKSGRTYVTGLVYSSIRGVLVPRPDVRVPPPLTS